MDTTGFIKLITGEPHPAEVLWMLSINPAPVGDYECCYHGTTTRCLPSTTNWWSVSQPSTASWTSQWISMGLTIVYEPTNTTEIFMVWLFFFDRKRTVTINIRTSTRSSKCFCATGNRLDGAKHIVSRIPSTKPLESLESTARTGGKLILDPAKDGNDEWMGNQKQRILKRQEFSWPNRKNTIWGFHKPRYP